MEKRDFDAVVIGSGPNGLAAAICLQQQGLSVIIFESKEEAGGGLRTAELTLPGFKHDVCSAVHPLAAASPYFTTLPLHQFGLEFINPPIAAAHPFDDGSAAILQNDFDTTAAGLGMDEKTYRQIIGSVVRDWPMLVNDILSPFHFPSDPVSFARFGLNALTSALHLSKKFQSAHAKALWAGMAAHSIQPLSNAATSAIALVLIAAAHNRGWPIAKGGASSIGHALSSYFLSIGGKIQTGVHVTSLKQLPSSHVVLFDVTPKQMLEIAGEKFSPYYSWQLKKYRYGAGVFKIDWALAEPIPFKAEQARRAGTVHLGGTLEEIVSYEKNIWENEIGEKPFVLLSQPSLFDSTRAPGGKHTGWAYCHVPNASVKDMTGAIEKQVERFAPGFTERILARHTFNTAELEVYNNNYIGGDINGGTIDLRQLFTRPALRWSPYRTSTRGLYICSSSTPPGGGVHGMCGYHAASRALNDIFNLKPNKLYEPG